MTPTKVFCSHRSLDKPAVEAFAARLRACGIDAWLDQWEIAAGDDFVAKINQGLAECGAALIFFSREVGSGKWVSAEISALIVQMIEDGRPIIPVMIDADAEVPPLLRPRARRGIEDFESVVDAILHRTSKPPLGPQPAEVTVRQFSIRLGSVRDGRIDIDAVLDGRPAGRNPDSPFSRPLQASYAEFLRSQLPGARHGSPDSARQHLERALVELGRELGAVLFGGDIGTSLAELLRASRDGLQIELAFEAAEPRLLALPFEAARLADGSLPAVHAAVRVLRRPIESEPRPAAGSHQASPGPLKILVAVGGPDEGQTRSSVLDLERELEVILAAVEPAARHGNAQVKILEVGHPDEIRKALKEDAFHVLHLSGHGRPGAIELENEDGGAVMVAAEQLAEAIHASGRRLPLVFLSSCHGGTAESETVGLAQGLIAHGIPLVVSMQTRVTDRYAALLAGRFYEELCRGDRPLASHALAHARRTLEKERQTAIQRGDGADQTQPEFATASLFSAGPESPLLDHALDRQPLRTPPVYRVEGPVPQLGVGELIGRRRELRETLRVLRDHPASVARLGRRNGIVLTGIGGVGKSSLAGRAMTRLAEEGWPVAAVSGPWNLAALASAVGWALEQRGQGQWPALGRRLADPQLDDAARLQILAAALQTTRLLVVLDNFEDNLTLGGDRFRDPATEALVRHLISAAEAGKLLVTSRYPVPASRDFLHDLHLPPLSPAETRKLLFRLEKLKDQDSDDVRALLRLVGGHPRMLEYVDALLRGDAGRVPRVRQRLREQARAAGVPLDTRIDELDEAIRAALLVGAQDVLLDDLVALADERGAGDVLRQAAVSSLPVDPAGLAWMLSGSEPSQQQVDQARQRMGQLADLSLLAPLGDDQFWVHRWTAEGLKRRMPEQQLRGCCRLAGQYRWWRVQNVSHALDDAVEAARNLLEAQDYDQATEIASVVAQAMQRFAQTAAVVVFVSEVLRELPEEHPHFGPLGEIEAGAAEALGLTGLSIARWQQIARVLAAKAAGEPDRADYQRDLSVSYERLGDLLRALGQGEEARRYYQKDLEIIERLAAGEPDRADYQRDLSVSYNKLGDLLRALGQGEEARRYYQKDLEIIERLAAGEPDRADYQRDLSVSYERLGDLLRALGQGEEARRYYQQRLEIAERLAAGEPDRADYQRDLSVSYNKLGDLLRALGQGEEARRYYQQSLEIIERLAAGEPDRADYQRDLSVSYERLGDLLRALGQGEEARRYYQKDLEIIERLAAGEPDRADYQRDLSVSYNKLGDLLRALGQGEEARRYYQQSLDIFERLAAGEPDRADYQRDLSVSYERLGDLLRALGQGEEARRYYQQSLDIFERLAAGEPDRADYQRDVVGSLVRAAQIDPLQATVHLRRALGILTTLHAENRLDADAVKWIPIVQQMLGQSGPGAE